MSFGKAKQPTLKGHEALLRAIELNGGSISVMMASDGEVITGRVKRTDKYTISLDVGGKVCVLFKSDISRFYPENKPND